MQQVEFSKIPNTQPVDYQTVIKTLLGYVRREHPDDKELKKHLKSRQLFDKDATPGVLELIGITTAEGKPSDLTPAGQLLFDIDDDKEWKKALFKHVAQRNLILVKSVFDALQERLYSVNEMFRAIDSWVYPGKRLTLPHFQAWMAWVEASGMIKYIGIRWGPSQLLKEMEEFLRGIDVEEILEDESSGAKPASDDDDEDSKPAKAAKAAGSGSDEDVPDAFDGPEPPGETAAAAAAAPKAPVAPEAPPPPAAPTVGHTARTVATAPLAPAAPAVEMAPLAAHRYALTLRSVAEIQEVQKVLELDPEGAEAAQRNASLDEAEISKNLEGLRDLWGTRKDKSRLSFASFGIDPDEYRKRTRKKGAKAFFLYRALVAATCAYRPLPTAGASTAPAKAPAERFGLLEQSGALSRHFQEGQSLDDVVTGLVGAAYGDRLDLLGLAPYLALARQATLDAETWLAEVEKGNTQAIWDTVYQKLHSGVFTLELIWLTREMALNQLWTAEGLSEAAVVPTQDVLDVAFRIGLVPLPYLAGFASALFLAKTLTGYCTEAHGLEQGLVHFGRQMGCAYNCAQRHTCSYFCREKLRR